MLFLLACEQTDSDKNVVPTVESEPMDLPSDPAERGVPVGQATVDAWNQRAEVWYPASDDYVDVATDAADFEQFVPASLVEKVGAVSFPVIDSMAVRDADPRLPEGEGYPVVVFSHGLGGMRIQSLDYAAHLASRGYVVVAVDHPGRRFEDLIPCIFSPALDGCDLSGFATDPALDDVDMLVDWVMDGGLDDYYGDAARLGMSGHSAGGGTTITAATDDVRIDAALVMAAPGLPERGPRVAMGASCDGFVAIDDVRAAGGSGEVVVIEGAGHLAFSDMCELDLADLAETLLAPRDDVNQALLGQFLALATDGCAGSVPSEDACEATEYLSLDASDPIVRHYATVFFDDALYGAGDGVRAGAYDEAEVP
ncbi:MAG: hypothetical protein FJ090_03725 [Deltaproteobacteria bacterium]|nr:hypothetical protein [Deltaproteobacteria bacterium]